MEQLRYAQLLVRIAFAVKDSHETEEAAEDLKRIMERNPQLGISGDSQRHWSRSGLDWIYDGQEKDFQLKYALQLLYLPKDSFQYRLLQASIVVQLLKTRNLTKARKLFDQCLWNNQYYTLRFAELVIRIGLSMDSKELEDTTSLFAQCEEILHANQTKHMRVSQFLKYLGLINKYDQDSIIATSLR